jgi:hypothetical protein
MSLQRYYINQNAQYHDGVHEIHKDDGTCPYPPQLENRRDLGWHSSCVEAAKAASNLGYQRNDGCYWCNKPCHTR